MVKGRIPMREPRQMGLGVEGEISRQKEQDAQRLGERRKPKIVKKLKEIFYILRVL